MKTETKEKIIHHLILVVILAILYGALSWSIFIHENYYTVAVDLYDHLYVDYPSITIISIDVIKQDSEGFWFFKIDCYNNDEGVLFSEYCRFNYTTKEIIGYDRLKYV